MGTTAPTAWGASTRPGAGRKSWRGSFPLLPQVGSRLYLLGREKPAARGTVGAGYAAEALADVPDLQVTGATWDEGGQRLHVELKWKGAPLMAEVPL